MHARSLSAIIRTYVRRKSRQCTSIERIVIVLKSGVKIAFDGVKIAFDYVLWELTMPMTLHDFVEQGGKHKIMSHKNLTGRRVASLPKTCWSTKGGLL